MTVNKQELEKVLLDASICPPDHIIKRGNGREAWVYTHGNILELLFVVDTKEAAFS